MENGVKKLEVVRDKASFTVLLRSEAASQKLVDVAHTIRLISTDGDGCVLPYHNEPDPILVANLQSVIKARGESFGFSVVTGNHEQSAAVEFATKVNCASFCEMGNVLHEPSGTVKVLVNENDVKFIAEVAKPLLDRFMESKFPGYSSRAKRTMLSYSRPGDVEMAEFVGAISSFMQNEAPKIAKELEMSYWTRKTVDITFRGNNKGKAIRYLSDYYRVNKSEMIYVGDGNNDMPAFLEVISGGGIAIAPANADKEIKEFFASDRTGRMILHPLESTECIWDIASTVFTARNVDMAN